MNPKIPFLVIFLILITGHQSSFAQTADAGSQVSKDPVLTCPDSDPELEQKFDLIESRQAALARLMRHEASELRRHGMKVGEVTEMVALTRRLIDPASWTAVNLNQVTRTLADYQKQEREIRTERKTSNDQLGLTYELYYAYDLELYYLNHLASYELSQCASK